MKPQSALFTLLLTTAIACFSACSDESAHYPPAQFRTESQIRQGLASEDPKTRLYAVEAMRVRELRWPEALEIARDIATDDQYGPDVRVYALGQLQSLDGADDALAVDVIGAAIEHGRAIDILWALYAAEDFHAEGHDLSALLPLLEDLVQRHRQTGVHPWTDVVRQAEKLIGLMGR